MLDVHVHMLLLYAVFGGALVCLLEVFHRGNVLLELLRAALSLLQGSWFWQVWRNVLKLTGLLCINAWTVRIH